jgi:RNA-binding signal recognition particle 68
MASSSSSPSKQPPLLRIFDTITAAQDVHGNVIRQPDNFRRYRMYCSHKMDRLRHHRDARSALVHNPKFPGATVVVTNAKPKQHRHAYGHRPTLLSQYQPIERETEAINTISPPQNLYYLLLFQAERAWAMACELQQGKKKVKTLHGHVQRRLNKAVKHAQQLLTLVETQQQQLDQTIDAVTVQECRAYLQWCQGNAALEHAAAANALDAYRLEAHRSYRQAHYALQRLVATADSSSSWRYFSNHVLFPLVRYTKHEARNLLDVYRSYRRAHYALQRLLEGVPVQLRPSALRVRKLDSIVTVAHSSLECQIVHPWRCHPGKEIFHSQKGATAFEPYSSAIQP